MGPGEFNEQKQTLTSHSYIYHQLKRAQQNKLYSCRFVLCKFQILKKGNKMVRAQNVKNLFWRAPFFPNNQLELLIHLFWILFYRQSLEAFPPDYVLFYSPLIK